ncbi:hypothetical protein E5288_WYG003703 [Bos mutus]|uniref:Uncharacterized protein n=1 Tax=Bos mutus TaxID=72004 RepID=A0A6B0S8N9_9CETA|nr:hypothetical protein [Bos mutus]
MEVPKPGSPQPQVAGLSANRSLTEGLILDMMNDSLSKILLDISFPGLEEDLLGPGSVLGGRPSESSVPLFDSPRELLNSEPFDLATDPFGSCLSSDMEVPKPGSPEPQVAGLSANCSLTEGLILDMMNDSLSKILLDISFPGLEEDMLGPGSVGWTQCIPDLR